MKFSLVTGTLGRSDVLRRLLQSLASQTHQDFELIVVDQNEDNRVQEILKSFQSEMEIHHLQLEKKGLSRARNHGLKHATGDIVGFPDDDCWYPEDLLEDVKIFFQENSEYSGLTTRSYTENKEVTVRRGNRSGPVKISNVIGYGKAISYCIFLRDFVINGVGKFDENVGVGAGTPWGSGEETDYLIRSLREGYKVYHKSDIKVFHPRKDGSVTQSIVDRSKRYGLGIGYVYRKNNIPLWVGFESFFAHSIGGIMWYALRGEWKRVRRQFARLRGRVNGRFGVNI